MSRAMKKISIYVIYQLGSPYTGENCDRGLENAARGHSIFKYVPTQSRQIIYLWVFSFRGKLNSTAIDSYFA